MSPYPPDPPPPGTRKAVQAERIEHRVCGYRTLLPAEAIAVLRGAHPEHLPRIWCDGCSRR